MNKEQAIAHIRASKLTDHADQLIEALRTSIRLHRRPIAIEDAALGASRFGGPPDLPRDFEWPSWTRKEKGGPLERSAGSRLVPLDFLAQINLGELPPCLPEYCPREGMLYAFYDTREQPWGHEPDHAPASRVIYHPGPVDVLRRTPPPEGVAAPAGTPCLIEAEVEWILPSFLEAFAGLEVEVLAEYEDRVSRPLSHGAVMHRMFGYPQCVQGEESLWEGEESSRHLILQLDTDDADGQSPGYCWGDCGRLYFVIRSGDLAGGDFERTRLTLQCS